MAYKWSWAFGPEDSQELDDLTFWAASVVGSAFFTASNSVKHTYTGDNADRYSLGIRGGYTLTSTPILPPKGWLSLYFYYNGTDSWDSYQIIQIDGPASGVGIEITAVGGGARSLQMQFHGSTVFTPSSPLGLQDFTWHHIGIKYDMTVNDTWGAEVFINGVSQISGSRTNSVFDPEDSAVLVLGGVRNGTLPEANFWSDIIAYDDLSDPNPFGQLVSRIEPYLDQSATSGTWTPAANILKTPGAQAENLSGSISTSPVVSEADPTTGEFVRVLSQDLGTNLGLPSFGSFGFTSHLFASGSSATNVISKFAVGAPGPPGTFTSGAGVIDGENAYAYASSGSTIYASGSTIYLQAEISGS